MVKPASKNLVRRAMEVVQAWVVTNLSVHSPSDQRHPLGYVLREGTCSGFTARAVRQNSFDKYTYHLNLPAAIAVFHTPRLHLVTNQVVAQCQ